MLYVLKACSISEREAFFFQNLRIKQKVLACKLFLQEQRFGEKRIAELQFFSSSFIENQCSPILFKKLRIRLNCMFKQKNCVSWKRSLTPVQRRESQRPLRDEQTRNLTVSFVIERVQKLNCSFIIFRRSQCISREKFYENKSFLGSQLVYIQISWN